MAGWIVLALWISVDSSAVQPATFNHVRSAESRVRDLIVEGYARSTTFRELVDTIEEFSCIVYVATAVKLSQGMRGALLSWSAGLDRMPVLRVLVKSDLSRDEAIATIAHELQHVVEVATAAPGAGAGDMSAVFAKLDPAAKARGTYKHETDAAIDVTSRVRDELRRVFLAQAVTSSRSSW